MRFFLDRIKKTVGICKRTTELEEKGVRLRLTVVDTPGFGDSINAQNSYVDFSLSFNWLFYRTT